MSGLLLLEQTLNGVQLGVLLFLMASGLTLVLGIMNVINLAHGSLFMLGAYFVVTFHVWTGSYALAVVLAVAGCFLLGLVLEFLLIRRLYKLDHLYQVLCTFGVILFSTKAPGGSGGRSHSALRFLHGSWVWWRSFRARPIPFTGWPSSGLAWLSLFHFISSSAIPASE